MFPVAYSRLCALRASFASLRTSLRLSCALWAGQCSALRFVLTPTMASADFCMNVPTPPDVGSTEIALGTHADLPGYHAPTFTLMPVGSTSRRSMQVSGFDDIGRLTPPCRLLSASCSSGQRFAFGFLQIRSHPRHPCRSANSSPCRASGRLPPPSECALPGAPKKGGPFLALPLSCLLPRLLSLWGWLDRHAHS